MCTKVWGLGGNRFGFRYVGGSVEQKQKCLDTELEGRKGGWVARVGGGVEWVGCEKRRMLVVVGWLGRMNETHLLFLLDCNVT